MQQIVTTMVHLMLRVDRPVTFVITKWDLLQDIAVDEDERLGFVRKHLMHNQNFRDLVTAHAAHRVVRLVPVSSVGPDFTALDHAGIVVKRPDGELRPTNADLPFAAVVPDVWDQIEQGVDQAELAAVFARLSGPTAKGRAAALSDAAGMLTQAAGRIFGLVNPVAGDDPRPRRRPAPRAVGRAAGVDRAERSRRAERCRGGAAVQPAGADHGPA